ncbi:hypothetical protein AX14_008393, partial [Amanita brunnescens Koide BX004]
LIPHADVLFGEQTNTTRSLSRSNTPDYIAFLLSLTLNTAPNSLIVTHWGSEGAAVLSVPAREYFQFEDELLKMPLRNHPETIVGRRQDQNPLLLAWATVQERSR